MAEVVEKGNDREGEQRNTEECSAQTHQTNNASACFLAWLHAVLDKKKKCPKLMVLAA